MHMFVLDVCKVYICVYMYNHILFSCIYSLLSNYIKNNQFELMTIFQTIHIATAERKVLSNPFDPVVN
jgi:hypothetical protein